MPNLLLIESPGKSKKLSQILGRGWLVRASLGHVRELTNDGEDALGFDLQENRVECRYEPRGARAKKVLADLRQAVKQADQVYIATDPDREGETIGWHLQQELRLKHPQRVVYSEITAAAVQRAIAHPRPLDQALIGAGRARDCLDKLVGYRGSKHLVWKLGIGAKSMGRVQSATLHLLCQREREIQTFKPQDYWNVWVEYQEGFKAFYRVKLNASKSAQSGELDDAASEMNAPESDRVTSQAEADRLVTIARSHPHQVVRVEGKTANQSPPPPFITSTLQQAAGSKLKFSPDKAMKVAQSLYEAGLITYMRTDSVSLSPEFCQTVRQWLEDHDPDNVPQRVTQHHSRKNAQEAHEAIRPTDIHRPSAQLRTELSADEFALYVLIWKRSVASQCRPARLRKTIVVTQSGSVYWEARGQTVEFLGYTRYWNNLSAEVELPILQQGQAVTLLQADSEQKQTQPPPRYTEPKLVQLMERQGIGRPSTYAPTIKVLKERDYVQVVKGKLQPTEMGLGLDAALEKLLPDLIQPEFTAQMEAALDTIAQGQQEWQSYLTGWNRDYFAPALAKAMQLLVTHPVLPSTQASHQQIATGKLETGKVETEKLKTEKLKTEKQSKKGKQILCPKCSQPLVKVASKSSKLKAKHFLSCDRRQGGCGTVMFWNSKLKQYELPHNQKTPDPDSLTDYPCPVCSALLERYSYEKEGKAKVMLRCAIPENRKGKCKDVAFFEGREGFWSPKFGELKDLLATR